MLLEGFLLGMLGQLAIGPVCLYILNIAISRGLAASVSSVLGVTLADGVYILLALTGVAGFVNNKKLQGYFRAIGGGVLVLFGAYIIYSVFAAHAGPKIYAAVGAGNYPDYFLSAFLLTISNPITIIFWSGVFTLNIAGKDQKKGKYLFAFGAVMSTFVFLTGVATLGTFVNFYFPPQAIKLLNLSTGTAIIIFGVIFSLKKTVPDNNGSLSVIK